MTDRAAAKRRERFLHKQGLTHRSVWVMEEDAPQVDELAAKADRAVKKHDEGEK